MKKKQQENLKIETKNQKSKTKANLQLTLLKVNRKIKKLKKKWLEVY